MLAVGRVRVLVLLRDLHDADRLPVRRPHLPPADADALYAEFAPLPRGPMAVDYDVEGPDDGFPVLLIAPGGMRSANDIWNDAR